MWRGVRARFLGRTLSAQGARVNSYLPKCGLFLRKLRVFWAEREDLAHLRLMSSGMFTVRQAPADELGQAADALAHVVKPARAAPGRSRRGRTCGFPPAPRRRSRSRAAAPVAARQLVNRAMRPPGDSTRRISSSASNGSANRFRAAKQQTASNEASTNGSDVASACTKARLSMPSSSVSCTARSSIGREPSTPTAKPLVTDGPREVAREVSRAARHVEHPVARPEAHQEPRDPLLLRHPGPGQPLGDAAQAGSPPALVDPAHRAGLHQVSDEPRLLEVSLQDVDVAAAGVGAVPVLGLSSGMRRSTAPRPVLRVNPRAARAAGSAAAAHGRRRAPSPGPPRASRCNRAIARSPSTRAGSSGARPSIRAATRSRICSAKCGVAGPTSSRTSSTVTR